MKKKPARIFVSFVILVFVNFMFSNVIFTHVHKCIDGRTITHSHPYIPSGSHGHTAQSLDMIAAFNAASDTAMATQPVSVPARAISYSIVHTDVISFVATNHVTAYSLRGPPALCA